MSNLSISDYVSSLTLLSNMLNNLSPNKKLAIWKIKLEINTEGGNEFKFVIYDYHNGPTSIFDKLSFALISQRVAKIISLLDDVINTYWANELSTVGVSAVHLTYTLNQDNSINISWDIPFDGDHIIINPSGSLVSKNFTFNN
jgi:hypothetical protein